MEALSELEQMPVPSEEEISKAYAELVRNMEDVLRDPDLVQKSYELLCELIERIELHPDPDARDGVNILIYGDLARMMHCLQKEKGLSQGYTFPSAGDDNYRPVSESWQAIVLLKHLSPQDWQVRLACS